MKISMSIDPSVRSCGYAIWKGIYLKKFGLLKSSSSKEDWRGGGHTIGALLHSVALDNDVEAVYCEFPAFFSGGKGSVTASSGALVKLAWQVGFLDGLFTPDFVPFSLIPVREWKGQLSKEIIEYRVRKILGKCVRKAKKDTIDALGIGLYVHGRMK